MLCQIAILNFRQIIKQVINRNPKHCGYYILPQRSGFISYIVFHLLSAGVLPADFLNYLLPYRRAGCVGIRFYLLRIWLHF